MLFVSLTSIVALWVWRDRIVARLETTFLGAVKKSIYLQPILLVVAIGTTLIYLWSAYDAYMTAKREPSSSGFVLWTLVLITFFFAGWQIGDIRPIECVSVEHRCRGHSRPILWPWMQASVKARRETAHCLCRS